MARAIKLATARGKIAWRIPSSRRRHRHWKRASPLLPPAPMVMRTMQDEDAGGVDIAAAARAIAGHTAATPILLDVSRLVWRSWSGRLPTGIDRVMLAYVAHYRDRARAVVHGRGYTRILPAPLSRILFDVLLNSGTKRKRMALSALLTASFYTPFARGTKGVPYLNVGHTGLNRTGHADWVARTGVAPVYLVHDLIPITHPQYCREGEDRKHGERIQTLLRCG
ncbi:MAG: hypothetical protein ABW048_04470, partial [Sphingobium sp.]